MVNFCKKACNICDFQGNLADLILMKGDVELLETPYGKAQTIPQGGGGALLAPDYYYYSERTAEIVQETATYMETEFYARKEYAPVHFACKNMDRSCAYWKAIGECEANHIFMWINCSPVCQ